MFGNNKITIPWYRRQIFGSLSNDMDQIVPMDFKKPPDKPKESENKKPQPELSPETVKEPAEQPSTSPNHSPSTNPENEPSPNDSSKIRPIILIPFQFPNIFNPFNPFDQPFPIPQMPVISPKIKPGMKPKTVPGRVPGRVPVKPPGRVVPFPKRRNPARVPAAAMELPSWVELPVPEYEMKPWEIVSFGGMVSLGNNTTDKNPWYNPIIDYATEIGAFGKDVATETVVFADYLKTYDYSNYSFTGMYGDLVGMYGTNYIR